MAAEGNNKPRALTDTDTMVLAEGLRNLKKGESQAHADVADAVKRGDVAGEASARARLKDNLEQQEANHKALRLGGRENARGSAIRNAILKDDYTIGRNMDRVKTSFGDKFNAGIKKQVEALSEQLKAKDAEIAKGQAEIDRLSNKPTRAKPSPDEVAQARIQKQMDSLKASIAKRLSACPV